MSGDMSNLDEMQKEIAEHEEERQAQIALGQRVLSFFGINNVTGRSNYKFRKPTPTKGKRLRGVGFTRACKTKSKNYLRMQAESRKINRNKKRKT